MVEGQPQPSEKLELEKLALHCKVGDELHVPHGDAAKGEVAKFVRIA